MKWFDNESGCTFLALVLTVITLINIYLDYDHERRINALEESCGVMCYQSNALWDLEQSRREQHDMD